MKKYMIAAVIAALMFATATPVLATEGAPATTEAIATTETIATTEATAVTAEDTAVTTAPVTDTADATEATQAIVGATEAIMSGKAEESKEVIAEAVRWISVIAVILINCVLILTKIHNNSKKQDNVVGAANELIDGFEKMEEAYNKLAAEYAKMREAYDKYGETETDRNRVIGAVMEQNAAILEILQFAYSNSSKLPQGIKDVINLKYANALKALANDEAVLAIVKAVREGINASTTQSGRTED